MPNVLTIDSSTNAVAVACGTSDQDAASRCVEQRAFHSENILVVIDEILKERSWVMKDIQVIGVGVGPGLFTGLRVGISAAHAFAHALDIPLVYFSSLELVANRLSLESRPEGFSTKDLNIEVDAKRYDIRVARDARRGEFYRATYSSTLIPVTACTIDTTIFSTKRERIVSESLIAYEEYGEEETTTPPDTRYMIDHVIEAVQAGVIANTFTPSALYIRKSDAELSWNIQVSAS